MTEPARRVSESVQRAADFARGLRYRPRARGRENQWRRGSPASVSLFLRGGFRPATATGRGSAGHLSGAVVAEVRLLCTAASVGIRQAQGRALALADFSPAIVTNQHGLSSQGLLLTAGGKSEPSGQTFENLRCLARPANTPRSQQAEERLLLRIETDISCADDA